MSENSDFIYELMVILSPDSVDRDGDIKTVRDILAEHGASVVQEDDAGIRELSYRIKKHDKGYYFVVNFNIEDASRIDEIEKAFNIEQNVLRYIVMRMPHGYQMKTLAEADAEYEKNAPKPKKKSSDGRKTTGSGSKPKPRKAAQKEEKVEKTEKAVKEQSDKKEEKTEKVDSKPKKEPKEKLKEVDDKLKSIIDDPDITL